MCRAGATGHLNNIIKEIIDQGQDMRNIVERRLRNDRLKEEQIMKMMIVDVAREEEMIKYEKFAEMVQDVSLISGRKLAE